MITFKLKINDKVDSKLLENFPKDPYSDIVVLTKTLELELSLAYLSIDSQFFAALPDDMKQVDLSDLNQQPLLFVLRSLYGGELQVASVLDLQEIYKIIVALKITQFEANIVKNLKAIHEQKPENSIFNSIELIQFCIKYNIASEDLLQFHFENRLKALESSKNYLQLGKLSDNTLNTILLAFSKREGEVGDGVVNHILENYFNRKSYRPADYFVSPELSPLRQIWEKFHHKVLIRQQSKLEKACSTQEIKETVPIVMSTRHSNTVGSKFGRLANLPAISTQSVNLTSNMVHPEMGEEESIDLRIQNLSKQLQHKDKRIEQLRAELKELNQLKAKKDCNKNSSIEGSIDEITILRNVVRSRKSREQQMERGGNSSVSENEFAFQNPKKEGERQNKIKLVSKNSMSKKMFS